MEKPVFSLIIPCLNEEKCLPLLLHDLENQTFKDFEVIVVDANSEDKTREKAGHFNSKFRDFTILTSKQRNVSYQRNLGSRKAKADWLIFMDADNRLPPYFIQGFKYQTERLDPDILTSWIKTDGRGKREQAIARIVNIYLEIQKNSTHPSALESMLCFKKQIFCKLRGFNQELKWGEGGDIMERAAKKGFKYQIVKEPKYTYSLRRIRKQGALKTFLITAELELSRLRNLKLPKEKSTYLYPMEGGSYFTDLKLEPKSRLQKLFNKLNQMTPLAHYNKPKNFLEKLFKNR